MKSNVEPICNRTWCNRHFPFFNYIVYNPELINQDELEAILLHEEAHSNQNHSVDTFISSIHYNFLLVQSSGLVVSKECGSKFRVLADEAAIAQVKDRIVYQKSHVKIQH